MITCENDTLIVEHAESDAILKERGVRFVEEWLPAVRGADWSGILEAMLRKEYAWVRTEEKEAARRTIIGAGADGLAKRFREIVLRQVEECRARFEIQFQRTLRLPDDGKEYPLPPGLGAFPLRKVEEHGTRVPQAWRKQGGVLMPIYQAEALWMLFRTRYPFALKVATGMVNAINGKPWNTGLTRNPQGYLVLPEQPWLDGYCVKKGVIRQFVAARLGRGYTAEEQLHGTEIGGLQMEAFPLKPGVFFEKQLKDVLPRTPEAVLCEMLFGGPAGPSAMAGAPAGGAKMFAEAGGMGLGAGGAMRQEIYDDPWDEGDWDLMRPSRVWIHLCDAARWLEITGEMPPQKPVTAKDYAAHRLPWFDYYREDMTAIEGSPKLAGLKTVFELAKKERDASVPQEEGVATGPVIALGPHASKGAVAEWDGN